MTTRLPQKQETSGAVPALDEFVPEAPGVAAEPRQVGEATVMTFACEPEPRPEVAINGTLLDLTPAMAPRAERQAYLSRAESLKARRERRRHARLRRFVSATTIFREWIARISASMLSSATRSGKAIGAARDSMTDASRSAAQGSGRALTRTAAAVRGGTRAIRRMSRRLASQGLDAAGAITGATNAIASAARAWTADGARAMAMPSMATAFDHQQTNGIAVAVLLAVSVVGYGSLLVVSWQHPVQPSSQPAPALDSRHQSEASALPATTGVPDVPAPVARAAAAVPVVASPRVLPAGAAPAVRRATFSPSPRTLAAMWQMRDTRSLDQAFSSLRRQTLAFHRCGMRMTDTNRAIARCEGIATAAESGGAQSARHATWTIAFARSAGRWQITRVTMQ